MRLDRGGTETEQQLRVTDNLFPTLAQLDVPGFNEIDFSPAWT